MKLRALLGIVISSVAVMLFAPGTQAKGVVAKVVLTGPDWYGELVVEDSRVLEHLGMAVFEDVQSSPKLPPNLGAGYLLDRFGDSAEDAQPFDRVVYFPDPAGGQGYVYYLETVNGHGPYDGRWFLASPEGESAIAEFLASHGVVVMARPAAASTEDDLVRGALALVPPLAGLLIGWLLGRRVHPGQAE